MDKAAFYAALRRRACPVFGTSLSPGQVNGCEAILDEACRRGTSLDDLAYALGTTYHETAHTMQPITEYGGRAYFDKYEPGTKIGRVLGNTLPGDGYRFRGRGYVMITGRRNYALASEKLGVNLLLKPELALRPDLAAIILFDGMTEGWFTGRDLSDYLDGVDEADDEDLREFIAARRVVNGTDRAKMIAGYAVAFEHALREAGYSTLKAQEPATDAREPVPAPGGQPEPPPIASTAKQGGIALAVVAAIAALAHWWQEIITSIETWARSIF